jgi:hypothetical protein
MAANRTRSAAREGFRESRFEGPSVLEAAFAGFRRPDLSVPPGSVEFGGAPAGHGGNPDGQRGADR